MKNTNESITQLKGADRVRLKPAVIFGSDGLAGCQHAFFEILSNSLDEARGGAGSEITVIRHMDHSITVIDHAGGIPVDYNKKEKTYNWKLLFTELFAGGKYQKGDNMYKFSLGTNGLGLAATQYASEYMDVVVHRDGFRYDLHFEKGEMTKNGFVKTPAEDIPSGTTITWRPDLDVFKNIEIPLEYFQSTLHRQAIVNPKITLVLKDEASDTVNEYYYARGILDYISEITDPMTNFTQIQYVESQGKGKDRSDLKEYECKSQLAFVFNNEVNQLSYFHNSSYLDYGGSPDRAVKSAFVHAIDKLIKEKDKYNKKEKKISFVDVEDSLVLISSSFSSESSYENQTKKGVSNQFLQDFMTDLIKSKLEVYFIENADEAEKIADQVLTNKRSREKAEKTRLNLKKTLSMKQDVTSKVKKFVDCRTKDTHKRELYILEGDSALGSCKLARDAEFQALMPMRGKILNCLKADYDRIFKSDVIIDLIKVLGAGVEIKSKHNDLETFDLEQLKWNKIIICTDADEDGFQIRGLVLTMIYSLAPTLIREGRVFIAETPLYEMTDPKGNTLFAYNDREKKEILQQYDPSAKIIIQRSKGLGENDPDMMWQTTMCPETRKLIRVTQNDAKATQQMFEVLLGDDLDGRKKFIALHGPRYSEQLDLS